ncbi:dTDP-4-amino-4,6-dideoxygalactose transaminase [Thermincola potens]|uniref:TDP-4-keto-6-deoxy-D-glucose transaminase n=1 Tax=Thermincola potens (strain JR) TaxID=635013 RepID=D5XB56_THEPJ|nr:dTDP-4-amino-4,6-dideoxygalactose transaminase [Thermincola potens]ADG81376.1 TDP-4-keto-6-deoxy-D-glucose transaminase [Thermincola potens JR]
MKVPFNIPAVTGKETYYIAEAIANNKLSGDGEFSRKCHAWLTENCGCLKALLTTSCTHALEMSAILAGIQPGDEVIMPSYTFVSTANAFVLRGAKIVFTDIRPDTMNMDEKLIERAVTERTKAIVPVHYAGVACDMDTIMKIAGKHNLLVIEDAAQAVMSTYKGKALGTIGHLGCYSFHDTKNYTCGEGGALLINDRRFVDRAEYIREKGTNRSSFLRGEVDKYSWIDVGSSYLPSELNAAFLYAQLEEAEAINRDRLKSWERYYIGLKPLRDRGVIELPHIPDDCRHNASIFYIKVRDLQERTEFLQYLREHGVQGAFHYVPLHSSVAGEKFGLFSGADIYTTRESERLVRLPLYYKMESSQVDYVIQVVRSFFDV